MSNAVQTPKLPDYAVVDVDRGGGDSPLTGVVAASFFDERWQLTALPK